MKVILTDGDLKFGMNDLQTQYYVTNDGEQIADFSIGQGVYMLNEYSNFDKVKNKEALNRLISRAFMILAAKFRIEEPGEGDSRV